MPTREGYRAAERRIGMVLLKRWSGRRLVLRNASPFMRTRLTENGLALEEETGGARCLRRVTS